MPTNTIDLEDLRKFIMRQVERHWAYHANALLLTTLGISIRNKFKDAEKLMPEGLKSFISSNSLAQIITHPTTPQKIGAVPLGVTLPDDPSSPLRINKKIPYGVRFFRDFWETFHTPINGRRFVIFSPQTERGYTIRDLLNDEPTGEAYEIRPGDLALDDGTPLVDRIAAKQEKIRRWLSRNNLDPHRLEETPVVFRSSPSISTREYGVGIFHNLEQQDQARILIPLDILIKLLHRP